MSQVNPMNGRVKPDVGDPNFILELNLFHHADGPGLEAFDPTAKHHRNDNLWELYE